MQVLFRAAVAVALFCGSAGAWAQALPKIEEFYFDDDAATQPLVEGAEGSGGDVVDRLIKLRERGGRNAESAEARLAAILMEGGRIDAGKDMYRDVLVRLDERSHQWRPVRWHYGWSLLRAGEAEAALAQWTGLVSTSAGRNPSWAPTALALALWKLDRRDEAVRWYAAAVRTWPSRWSGTSQYAQLLPDWRDGEREALAEVQAAWAQEKPAWP